NKMTFTWNGKTESFLVLAPQCRKVDTLWYSYYIDEMINYAKKNLQVDTNRIILTGFSMGGGGTWAYAADSKTNGKKLAAIAPICPACLMNNGKNIADANVPVYAFHALNDTTSVALPICTKRAIDSINKYNPITRPQATFYTTGGHSIWRYSYDTTYVYQNPNIYEWFLNQDRSKPANKLPIAVTNNDTLVHSASATLPLVGTLSSDPDGTIFRYQWRQVAGPSTIKPSNSTTATATAAGMKLPGVYKFELKVTDNRASFSVDTISITVNTPPVASAGPDQVLNLPLNSTTLNGSTSTDANGTIVSYAWTKTSGPTALTMATPLAANTTISGLTRGIYKFRLTVKDNQGAMKYDDVIIYVNAVPVAKAGADSTLRLPKNTSTLIGSGSSDQDGIATTTFLWEQIAGPGVSIIDTPTKTNPKVSNLIAGTYSFRLTVTDVRGASSKDTALRIVLPALAGANLQATAAEREIVAKSTLKVSPNASSTSVLVTLQSSLRGSVVIRVFDGNGKQVKRINTIKDSDLLQQRIPVQSFGKGMYIVEVHTGNHRFTEKFVRK
ncbi:MAG TPA: T9SS type A sorting domain-containing protein, partial [Flavitalea sp.]|nr:T9SS type A sorting domain-containing protein [Flavitalea sp.]